MRSIRSTLPSVLAAAALVLALATPVSAAAAGPGPISTTTAAPPAATTFTTPLKAKSYTVSSYYGPRCMSIPGASTFHLGLDMAAPGGSPIYAVAAGVVVATVDGTSSRAGYITIRHSLGGVTYTSIYYHIWKSTTRVTVGRIVAAGQRISEVGTSGVSGGNHLHLEIWQGAPGSARSLDPAPFLKTHGVDLYRGAKAVLATKPPTTCTYYVTTLLNFRTAPSLSSAVLRVLPVRTAAVAVAGQSSNGYFPVRVGTQSGWLSSGYLSMKLPPLPPKPPAPAKPPVVAPSPTGAPAALPGSTPKPAAPKPAAPKPAASKPAASKPAASKPAAPKPAASKPAAPKPATYKTTSALNFRRSPSLTGAKIRVIPRGASVGTVKATSGVWRKVVYLGTTGWVHSAYLAKR
nr:peptidoglycan DD-metalloendopeptidase family protein [Microbacterium bovistercoris]